MKIIILLSFLISLTTHASVYNCRAGQVRLELKPDADLTTLTVRDARTGEFYFDGVVSEFVDENNRLKLRFETRFRDFLELSFKASDIAQENETILGIAQGWSGLGFINQSIRCARQ